MAENRILLIDDDAELCELLVEYLEREGFAVESVNEGAAGLSRALSGEHALVVLDVMLPEMNGFDVLRRIREKSKVPVLMLTARGDDVDRIVGLEMGADDYLPKPFNSRELVARIRAVKRRAASVAEAPVPPGLPGRLKVGDVELEPESRVVRKAGKVVPREELAKAALGRKLSSYDRSIDVHMSSLRRELGHRAGPLERIRNIRAIGYMYARTSDPDA